MKTKILQQLGTTEKNSSIDSYIEMIEESDVWTRLMGYFEKPTFISVGVLNEEDITGVEDTYYIWKMKLRKDTKCPRGILEEIKRLFDDDNQPEVLVSYAYGTLTIYQEVWN